MFLKKNYLITVFVNLFFAIIVIILFFCSKENRITPDVCKNQGLPVLFVDTLAGKKINSKTDYVPARYEIDGIFGECKIRGHGNTTWQTREFYKKPYLLKLNEPNSILGMEPFEKWVLISNTADKTSLRNEYSYYLSKNVWNKLKWTPESRFVALFLNGKYNGLYSITEKIEYEKLNLKEGSFLACVNSRMNKEWNFETLHGIKISIRMKNKTETEYKQMQSIIQQAENSIFSDDFLDKEIGWRCFIDEDSLVDWYLINEWTKNHDAAFQSSCYFFYDSITEKIYMGPIWDFDISAGNINYDECEKPEGYWINTSQWYKRLFQDKDFVNKVVARYNEKTFELEESLDWINNESKRIKPFVEINNSVWPNIGKRQWPHAPGWKNRKTYEDEVDYMVKFLQQRKIWLDKELCE